MLKRIKRFIYIGAKALLSILYLGMFYVLSAFIFGLMSVNNNFDQEAGEIEIFLVTNGTHASLALPALTEQKNWIETFNPREFKIGTAREYIQIGWGSKTFYTQVPRWKDLRPLTAVRALLLDNGVLNVNYIDEPEIKPSVRSIKLTRNQYQKLIDSIENDIDRDKNQKPKLIKPQHPTTDTYFEAKSVYTPWRTCNQWTRNILSKAEVSVPVWAPFSQTLFWHLN